MTDQLLALIGDWGALAVGVITFLACAGVPIPALLAMLAAGAFAASGDLDLLAVGVASLAGALAGDQVGYGIGRLGRRGTESWIHRNRARAALFARAQASVERRGMLAVFLSRWLVSALGPYVNLLAGVARMNWPGFSLASLAGETLWVGIYVGLGYAAGANVESVATAVIDLSGLAASGALTLLFGWALWRRRTLR